jgi:hypothetical protein
VTCTAMFTPLFRVYTLPNMYICDMTKFYTIMRSAKLSGQPAMGIFFSLLTSYIIVTCFAISIPTSFHLFNMWYSLVLFCRFTLALMEDLGFSDVQ